MKKFLLILMAVLLASCAEYTRSGKLKDEIFGVEHRANGAIVVWVVHDDVGSYCFSNDSTARKAEELFNTYDGKVVITYYDGHLFDGCPQSTEHNHVYTAIGIEKAESEQAKAPTPTPDTGR